MSSNSTEKQNVLNTFGPSLGCWAGRGECLWMRVPLLMTYSVPVRVLPDAAESRERSSIRRQCPTRQWRWTDARAGVFFGPVPKWGSSTKGGTSHESRKFLVISHWAVYPVSHRISPSITTAKGLAIMRVELVLTLTSFLRLLYLHKQALCGCMINELIYHALCTTSAPWQHHWRTRRPKKGPRLPAYKSKHSINLVFNQHCLVGV